jgi:hypothetical protein
MFAADSQEQENTGAFVPQRIKLRHDLFSQNGFWLQHH